MSVLGNTMQIIIIIIIIIGITLEAKYSIAEYFKQRKICASPSSILLQSWPIAHSLSNYLYNC